MSLVPLSTVAPEKVINPGFLMFSKVWKDASAMKFVNQVQELFQIFAQCIEECQHSQ